MFFTFFVSLPQNSALVADRADLAVKNHEANIRLKTAQKEHRALGNNSSLQRVDRLYAETDRLAVDEAYLASRSGNGANRFLHAAGHEER